MRLILCNEPEYGSSCESWWAHSALTRFVRVSQLLLIFDVVSAFSVLAAASAAVGSLCQSFFDGWPARLAATSATSAMLSVVNGRWSSNEGEVC